jgi:hypothetical protein
LLVNLKVKRNYYYCLMQERMRHVFLFMSETASLTVPFLCVVIHSPWWRISVRFTSFVEIKPDTKVDSVYTDITSKYKHLLLLRENSKWKVVWIQPYLFISLIYFQSIHMRQNVMTCHQYMSFIKRKKQTITPFFL